MIPAPRHPRPSHRPVRRRGFTLIEVIVTIVVLSIIGGVASRILFQAFGALNDNTTRSDLSDQLAAAMERVTTELRTMQPVSGSSPPTPDITACTAGSISFRNTSNATRTISLSGSTLVVSGSAATTRTIATGISAFTIQAYDASNAALPASPTAGQIATIRRVQITITAASGSTSETLRTKVYLRCMALGSGSS